MSQCPFGVKALNALPEIIDAFKEDGITLNINFIADEMPDGTFKALYVQGEDIAQSDPNTAHVTHALRSMELVVVQDLFLNETAAYAHVFLPGTAFLEKDGTFTNAERRINRVRPVMAPRPGKYEWEVACELAAALGRPMHYDDAAAISSMIAAMTPTSCRWAGAWRRQATWFMGAAPCSS